MATITTKYLGNMLFESQVGNHTVRIDVPDSMGGSDRAPQPPQYFILSLGGCVAALVAEYCEHHNIDDTGMTVDMEFEKVTKPTQLTNIKTVVKLPNAEVHQREKAVRHVIEHCPVHETVINMTGMEIEVLDKTDLALAEAPPSNIVSND